MNREIWWNKEIDLLKSLEEEDYDCLIEYAYNNQQHLISEWDEEDISFLQKKIRFGMSILRYFEHHLQKDPKIKTIFRLGALMGTVESFEQLLLEKTQDDWTNKTYKEEVLSIKHLDDIILALEVHGVMSHSEICKYLDLKESTLSEIMKKVNLTNLISFSKSGKYKLYRLTDSGRRLGKQLRKQKNEVFSEKEILFQLKHYVESTIIKEEFRQKIKEILEYDSNYIEPGDSLTIVYHSFGKREKEEFEITGILENGKRDDKNLKIMGKKKKYDRINDFSNYKKEWESA